MNEAWLEKTEQYLNNEMSAEERLLFEAELKKNDDLFSYVNLYKEIETSMRSWQKDMEYEAALKASLNNLGAIYFKKDDIHIADDIKELNTSGSGNIQPHQNKKQKAKKTLRIIAVAAAIIGAIVLSVMLYLNSSKKNNTTAINKVDTGVTTIKPDTNHLQKNKTPGLVQKNADSNAAEHKPQVALTKQKQQVLFSNYFKPDAVPGFTEGPLEDAFTYYVNHNYAGAAEEFSTAKLNTATRGLETDPKLTAFYAHYYAGLSYLANAEAIKAIPELKKAVRNSPGSFFKIKAEWYLSLSYLKTGEIKNATELLTKISSGSENKYKLKASKLLNELATQ